MPRNKGFSLKKDGWCEGVTHLVSPHFNERPDGVKPTLVVLHCISLPPGCFATGAFLRIFSLRGTEKFFSLFRVTIELGMPA